MTEYKGPRFTREQLVFVLEAAYAAVLDRVVGTLPPTLPREEARLARMAELRDGAVEVMAIFPAVLYAQLTDDGLGCSDFPQHDQFRREVEGLVKARLEGGPEGDPNLAGTVRHLAQAFVGKFFADYLKDPGPPARATQYGFWAAVNTYAEACGGDTGPATLGRARSDAVVRVERAAAAYSGVRPPPGPGNLYDKVADKLGIPAEVPEAERRKTAQAVAFGAAYGQPRDPEPAVFLPEPDVLTPRWDGWYADTRRMLTAGGRQPIGYAPEPYDFYFWVLDGKVWAVPVSGDAPSGLRWDYYDFCYRLRAKDARAYREGDPLPHFMRAGNFHLDGWRRT